MTPETVPTGLPIVCMISKVKKQMCVCVCYQKVKCYQKAMPCYIYCVQRTLSTILRGRCHELFIHLPFSWTCPHAHSSNPLYTEDFVYYIERTLSRTLYTPAASVYSSTNSTRTTTTTTISYYIRKTLARTEHTPARSVLVLGCIQVLH